MKETFSQRLRKALDIKGMSQADLVKITGIGKSTISQYLSGLYVAKQENVNKISLALNVSPSWLMGLTDTMEKKIIRNDLELASWMRTLLTSEDEDLYKLLKIISQLDDDKIKTLLVMAEALDK